jgi:hypothetical protein
VEPHRLADLRPALSDAGQIRERLGSLPRTRLAQSVDTLVPVLLAVFHYALGTVLKVHFPHLGTSGPQMLIWGFFISSTVLFHGTVTINSLDHMIGSRRYDTPDTSRNNWLLTAFLGHLLPGKSSGTLSQAPRHVNHAPARLPPAAGRPKYRMNPQGFYAKVVSEQAGFLQPCGSGSRPSSPTSP